MKKTITIIATSAAVLGLAACDVDQTQDLKVPDVDVDVKGGQLPKFDVDAPDVDVKMEEKTIKVPVPDIDITPPAKDGEDGIKGTADDNLDDQ